MEQELHHLESQSVYVDQFKGTHRPMPNIPEDGISTPKYEDPVHDRRTNQIMYHGLINPNPYDGSSDPRVWLSDYNDVADANLWDEDVKFKRLISCLKGAPLQYYRNEKSRNPTFNWKQFSKGLVDKFTNGCESLLSQINIMRRYQKKEEPFINYWVSKLNLIELTAPTMKPEDKMIHMFNGLKSDLKSRVLTKFMSAPPPTLEEMEDMIKKTDDAMSFSQTRRSSNDRSSADRQDERDWDYTEREQEFSGQRGARSNQIDHLMRNFEQMNRKLDKLARGQMTLTDNPTPQRTVRFAKPNPIFQRGQTRGTNGANEALPTTSARISTPRRNIEDFTCFKCGEKGHFANTCPNRRIAGECFNCGERGHYSYNCPQRKVTVETQKNETRRN